MNYGDIKDTHDGAMFEPGTALDVGGASYVYVKLSEDSEECNRGDLCSASASDPNVVAVCTVQNVLCRGVAIGNIKKNWYGWIQTWGQHPWGKDVV